MKNLPLSYIEISKNNLIHNIKLFRSLVGARVKISVAIKGNAYGHGQNEVAKILEPYVDYFQVNSIEELALLREVSKKKTFVLGFVENLDLQRAMKLGCILTFFSLEQLSAINMTSQKLKKIQEIHLPVDAYFGREGFLLNELPKVFKEIKKCKFVKLSGIYAHFANIEDTASPAHSKKQIKEYDKALKIVSDFGFNNGCKGGSSLQTHISATSGILVYEKERNLHSIVRLGIGVYGMWPSEHLRLQNPKLELRPVLTWKTKVAQIKILPKGFSIGYGLTYKTKKETKIALIPQGYADGFDRGFSNNGEVLIGGTRCQVLGRISMNMFTANVSHLPKVKAEDEVVLLGCQGGEEITAEELAKKLDTINYEVTTRVSSLLPKVVV